MANSNIPDHQQLKESLWVGVFFFLISAVLLNKRERIKKSINECPSVSDNFISYTKENSVVFN